MRRLLGLWWISWFGLLGSFFMVGVGDYKHESPAASHFSLTLMIVTGLLWMIFFLADARAKERSREVIKLLTLAGTFLAVLTLLGIGYFVAVAPRVE